MSTSMFVGIMILGISFIAFEGVVSVIICDRIMKKTMEVWSDMMDQIQSNI